MVPKSTLRLGRVSILLIIVVVVFSTVTLISTTEYAVSDRVLNRVGYHSDDAKVATEAKKPAESKVAKPVQDAVPPKPTVSRVQQPTKPSAEPEPKSKVPETKPGQADAKSEQADAKHDQPQEKDESPSTETETETSTDIKAEGENRRFVLILPETNSGPYVCSAAAAAMALGYPAPVIINWEKDWQTEMGPGGNSHYTKITGLLNYLEQMLRPTANDKERLHDDDIIIMMDAHDCWFQVTPEVLLQRYHDTNREANKRFQEEWGTDSTVPYEQTIIVSTQKNCWGGLEAAGMALHCKEVPKSPLRDDLYGPETGKGLSKTKPASVNSGVIIGPAGDLRRYLSRVRATLLVMIAHEERRYVNDQGLFGHIWAKQELWRTAIRANHGKDSDGVKNDDTFEMAKGEFEYSVGVDYYQDISMPLAMADFDGDFVFLSNTSGIDAESASRNITPTRVEGVPKDIAKSWNPLTELEDVPEEETKWENMRLFVDFFKGNAPAIVHLNAFKDGRHEWRSTKWDLPWFFPHLRPLLERALSRQGKPLEPIAKVKSAKDKSLEYFGLESFAENVWPKVFKEGDWKRPMESLPFDQLCVNPEAHEEYAEPWHQLLLRDGKGPLVKEKNRWW